MQSKNGLRHGARRALVMAVLMATTAGGATFLPAPAMAQQASSNVRSFDISAQPLPDALILFGRQAGIEVTAESANTQGRTTQGVSGSLAPAEALSRLLAGTGLTFRWTSARAVMIEPAPQSADGALQLGPVRVEGEGGGRMGYVAPPQAVLGNLPPEYAGGQVARGGQVGMLGNKDVMDTPFSQTSYTNKIIRDQQARTINDVLNIDPSVITTTGRTAQEADFIRGFESNSYGASRSLNGLSGMAPLAWPSADYIERVEVLKGSSALLNGISMSGGGGTYGGQIGGSVNLVTKQAGDEPLTRLTTRYVSNSQLGAHVDFGRRFGENKEFGIRFNGSFGGGDTPVDGQTAKDGNLALNLDYRGERVRLSADIAHQWGKLSPKVNQLSLRNVLYSLSEIPGVPSNSSSIYHPSAKQSATGTLGMLRGEVDITDKVTAYAAIGKQRYDVTDSGAGFPELIDESGFASAAFRTTRYVFDILSMQGGVRATLDTGPVAHALSLNVSHGDWQQKLAGNEIGDNYGLGYYNIYNPMFDIAPVASPLGDLRRYVDAKTSSIGIADTLSFLDERIQFTAGLRYQKMDTYVDYGGSYEKDAWTPAFGLVVKPRENVSLYASYIEGLEQGQQVYEWFANAGEVFPTYISKQYEAGVKVDWGRVTTTLAAFQIARPNGVVVPTAGSDLLTLTQDGEQRNRGIELNAYGEIVHGVRLLGGVTFLDARQTKTANGALDGERAILAPKVRAVIGGEWDTPFVDGLTLNGRFTYTSNQLIRSPDLPIPSWWTLDLGARYTFDSPWNDKPVTVRFNVDNVFNENYWKGANGGSFVFQGEPRTFRLSATFDF